MAEDWSATASGAAHSCGIRSDFTLTCWGDNQMGQTVVPLSTLGTHRYKYVSAGYSHTCAIDCDNRYRAGYGLALLDQPEVLGVEP